MDDDNSKGVLYAFYVYGIVPEFLPGFAFRREKHFKTAGKKIIKCPHCKKTFTTVDENVKVEIYPHSSKTKVVCHKVMPCMACNRPVGIIYANRKPA